MARPKRVFSDEQVQDMYGYALNGCQNKTISKLMCIAESTLIRRFGAVLEEKRAERKFNLRENQTNLSKNNPAMAIFLGKNELNQTDKQVIETKQTPLEQTDAQRKATEAAAQAYKLKLVRPSA